MSEYRELQERAKELGVNATGSKEELEKRIEEAKESPPETKGRKRKYFFPDKKVTVEASSKGEAYEKIKEL